MLIILAILPLKVHPIIAYDVIRDHVILSYLIRLCSKLLGTIVIDRTGNLAPSSVKSILGVLRDGGIVGIAPEGTRSQNGKLQRGRKGAAYFARKANSPILPVASLDYKKRVGLRHEVQVIIGRLYWLNPIGEEPLRSVLESDTQQIMLKLNLLMDESIDRLAG